MSLTIIPNTAQTAVIGLPICFEGSAIVSIQSTPLGPMDIATSGATWTYNKTTTFDFQKTGGILSYSDCIVATTSTCYGFQPFYIRGSNISHASPGGANNNVSWVIGVTDDDDNLHYIEVYKYCNATPTPSCSSGWFMTAYFNGAAIYNRGVNFNENFYVRSDGINLYFEHMQGGVIIRDAWRTLPPNHLWRFRVAVYAPQNTINALRVWKGSFQGSVPVTWSAPLGGALVVNGNTGCFTASSAGSYQVCIESEFEPQICVDIEVDDIILEPIGLDCGQCVLTDQVVEFSSNAGVSGVLTVLDAYTNEPVGSVLGPLSWQAPGGVTAQTQVIATYTVETDEGPESATCNLFIMPRLKVINVVGDTIAGLVPGDTFQILTNYEYPNFVWENIDCPNIVSQNGIIHIPSRMNDTCFGALDCYIRGKLINIPIGTPEIPVEGNLCDNLTSGDSQLSVTLRIITDPVYPTPNFGGPPPVKWQKQTPEYKVLVNEFEGGCNETYLKNRIAIQRWTVKYEGLRFEDDNPCAPDPCCDEEQGFINGYDNSYLNAKRLDDFWNTVAGTAGYFTLVDMRTGDIWRRARFEDEMGSDHVNWRTTNSRDVSIIWNPCCATGPMGGVCQHNTTTDDTFPPSIPQNISVEVMSWNRIDVLWDRSYDNVGVEYYELWVDGVVENVGPVLRYHHTGLAPTSLHRYKVRAFDFSGNYSDWSEIAAGVTHDHDILPPIAPANLVAVTVSETQINLSWDATSDNWEVAGYMVLLDGISLDVGNVLTYEHTGLLACTSHSYYVRAYDTSGNRSAWSDEVIAHTECGQVYEDGEEVYEGGEPVME